MVLKRRVLHLHGNEAWNKLLTFRSTYNKNITEKLSTHITEVFNKQYLQFQSNVSCNFAKIKSFEKSKVAAKMAIKMAGILWNNCYHNNTSSLKLECYYKK